MADTIRHRGPDDGGTYCDEGAGFALGFRRLAILDLSPAGHQPMTSASGRFTIAFNGEIYNYRELRTELHQLGARFRGASDTEVVLAAMEHWGVANAWSRLWGMFAIAVWDSQARHLHLARDRFGKKPLYVGRCGATLLFASELKALTSHPAFSANIDREVLTSYIRYGYVPGEASIYEGIVKVPPGCALRFDSSSGDPQVMRYWSALDEAHRGIAARDAEQSPEAAEDELHHLLRDAVGRRMVADVPLGAFLSGGIDSTLVTALMAQHSSQRVRTFTMGFESDGYDEAAAARAVANVLDTEHIEFRVTAREALDLIPTLPNVYDEPFADSSQIPTYLVARLARTHVTVALSGDGGDEVFGGYVRYQWLPSSYRQARRLPRPVRAALARGMTAVSPAAWDRGIGLASYLFPSSWRQVRSGEKLHKLASVISAASVDEAYLRTVSFWTTPQSLVVGGADRGAAWDEDVLRTTCPDPVDRLMVADTISYLPGDVLTKVDRATMAVSLEARAPLLDHRLYAWAWKQPQHFKIRDGRGKWLLRRLLTRYVPASLFDRPKMGFGVPVGEWLRGPLRPWAEALLEPQRLRREGYLHAETITPVWQAHLRGYGAHEHRLWTVLMFQAWLEARR